MSPPSDEMPPPGTICFATHAIELKRCVSKDNFQVPYRQRRRTDDRGGASGPLSKAHATRNTFDNPPSGLGWSARLMRFRPSVLAP